MSNDTDINNWLNYMEKLNKNLNNKKRKRDYRKNELNGLRITAIENLISYISEENLSGRKLTNFLSKLEYTFTMTKEHIKKDYELSNNDDYMILLIIALCCVMIEIIQDIKLESYEAGRKFNVLKYLNKIMNDITYTDNNNNNKILKLSFGKLKNNRKVNFKNDKANDVNVEQVDYEEFSDNNTSNDENDENKEFYNNEENEENEENDENDENKEFYNNEENDENDENEGNEENKNVEYTKEGYELDNFVVDDDDDDEDYDEDEDEDEDEDKYYEDEDYEDWDENCEDIIKSSSSLNKKLNMKFLKEFKKISDKFSDSSQDTIQYYCNLDKDVREDFLNKVKEINNDDINREPILFKFIKMNIPKDQKNYIIKQYFNSNRALGDNTKIKTWLSEVLKIPFDKFKGIDLDKISKKNYKNFLKSLETKMNEAVWGHENAKRKIVQMMAQKLSNPKSKGNVLGIWGPPGNGKTTLIKEGIAKAMEKPFVFISLGGATDASFLEGHSYTYEGSIYGRIARGIIESKCMNPIIYFDELDKISKTQKGEEITNMLVHLIDPVQNSHFRDKYFHGLDFDLSRVTFIFSFNEPHNVNHILMDRITTIETKYLIPVQKMHIVKNYLLPNIYKDMGGKNNNLLFPDETINHIIDKYTYEGGVRKLKTILYSVCRELNLRKITGKKVGKKLIKYPFKVKKSFIKDLVKEYREMDKELIHDNNKVGIVNGMWAGSLGIGGILSIETMLYPSKSLLEIKATGSLEKVIKESIEVACSLAWNSISDEKKNFWMKKWKDKPEGFHIHCPEGATPKDGPSAGAALTLAIYSVLMNKKINHKISMTGEINLKGHVTKIGGLEEKLQGAKNAGVKLALIPKDNLKDLKLVKERNVNLLDNTFDVKAIETFDDVMKLALI